MKKISISVALLTTGLLAAAAGCSIHPPDNGTNLGAPTTVDAINAVLVQAQMGVSQAQAFHVNDNGTVQLVDTILDSYSAVRETDTYQITSIDTQNINYLMDQIDSNECYNGQISVVQNVAPTPTPTPKPSISTGMDTASRFEKWMLPFKKTVASIGKSISHLFRHITVEPSTALGSAGSAKFQLPILDPRLKIQFRGGEKQMRLLTSAGQNLTVRSSFSSGIHLMDSLNGPVPCNGTTEPTPTPTPVATPSPQQPSNPDQGGDLGTSDDVTHQYYTLTYYVHPFTTTNCTQLANCTVTSTHVEYDDVQTDSSGNSSRFHWTYEISNQVPGLFFVLQECFATLVVQQGEVLPLTRCQNVSTFSYGSPPSI